MRLVLYVVHDRLAEEVGPIFEARNDAVALRNFRKLMESNRPEEYKLLRLGVFDHDAVKFDLLSVPEEVLPGKEVEHE